MKHFLWILLLSPLLSFAQQGYVVDVKIGDLNGKSLRMYYRVGTKIVIDSDAVATKDGFQFKGTVTEPYYASVFLYKKAVPGVPTEKKVLPPSLAIILSNDHISINVTDIDKLYMADVKGGVNDDWSKIRPAENEIMDKDFETKKTAFAQLQLKDSSLAKKYTLIHALAARKIIALHKEFVVNNPDSFLSLYFFSETATQLTLDSLEKKYNALGPKYKSTQPAMAIAARIDKLKSVSAGHQAIALNKKDINGNSVNLETLKGKYVLLDFWGSWCGPCRASHPHLKEIYAKYKDKGFEIVGIAQEKEATPEAREKAWKGAITKDGLPWIQIMNNIDADKFNAVAAYGVNAFPTKILLDKDGKIVGTYVGNGNTEFTDKLQEIFKF